MALQERLGQKLLYLSRADVVSAGLAMSEIIAALEIMFREKGEGRVEMPPKTGIPIAVMDATWITAQRTGAATALSAKYLARPESSAVGILGCGVQGRSNLEALAALFSLKKIYAYDAHADRSACYADEMSAQLGVETVPGTHPQQAVLDSDIVLTAGPILR